VAGGIERQRHTIAGDSPNFQDNIVANMDPFTHFSTKHQHRENSLSVLLAACKPAGIAPGHCGRALRLTG
jgi:hypothetical protein